MRNVITIGSNAIHQILHQRVVHAVLLVGIGIIALIISETIFMDMAVESGEDEMLANAQKNLILTALYPWYGIVVVLSIVLGTTAITAEIKQRTILAVLSRPVHRWQLLLGKFFGIVSFLIPLMAFGLLFIAILASYYNVYINHLFIYVVIEIVVDIIVLTAIALALGTLMSGAAAGGVFVAGYLVVSTASSWETSNYAAIRILGSIVQYITPASNPEDLISASLSAELLDPNYGLYIQIMTENLLYATTVFLIAATLFSRRQILLSD